MKLRYRVMLGALLLPSALAAAPCDQAVGEAETMALKVDECARFLADEHVKLAALANVKPSTGSRGLVDTRTWFLPADVSSPPAKALLDLAVNESVRAGLVSYYAYSAFTAADAGACDKLAVIKMEIPCRDEFINLRTALAAQSGPRELAAACRLPQRDIPHACCGLIASLAGRDDPCAALVPNCFREAGTCRAFWDGMVNGDAKACSGLRVRVTDDCKADGCLRRRAERIARCEEEAAYARAFKAKDAGLCAGSLRCRALMGDSERVAEEINASSLQNPGGAWFLKNGWKPPPLPVEAPAPPSAPPRAPSLDYRGFLCSDPIRSLENRKAAFGIIEAAQACLAAVEADAGVPPLELAEELDERAARLARLSLVIEKTFSPVPRLSTRDR